MDNPHEPVKPRSEDVPMENPHEPAKPRSSKVKKVRPGLGKLRPPAEMESSPCQATLR